MLISFESLRSDAVSGWGGPPGLTPHFQALSRRASWVGTALASASEPKPALASFLTGLEPRTHRVRDDNSPLDRSRFMLAEAFRSAGYATTAFREFPVRRGWDQGFDRLRATGRLRQTKEHLSGLSSAPSFTWIHFESLGGTLVRHDRFLGRLRPAPPKLPTRLGSILRKQQMAAGLSVDERQRLWALYCLNVAALDEALGNLIAAFEASGQWDRGTFVVAGTQGLELDQPPLGLPGLSLRALETPLLVKLPRGSAAFMARPGQRVGLSRLFATLLESAHISGAPAAVAPSLFRSAPQGVPSMWFGERQGLALSWIEGDHQLLKIGPGVAAGLAAAQTRFLRFTPADVEAVADDALRVAMEARMEAEYVFFQPRAGWAEAATPVAE